MARPKKKIAPLLGLLLLSLLFLLNEFLPAVPQEDPPPSGGTSQTESTLQVHFIDVGQAECTLLLCDGEAALIDGGNRDDAPLVVDYLQEQGVTELSAVFCTHPHEDHVGGLGTVLDTFPAKAVYCPMTEHENGTFRYFVRAAQRIGSPVTVPEPGDTFSLGSCTLTVFGPLREYENLNSRSLVMRVDHQNSSLLLTGDMRQEAEQDLIAAGCDLNVDLLQVGHHGSYDASGYEFLWNVMPRYAVISAGVNNDYGHPHKEVLSRLKDAKAEIYRTDLQGHIVATSDGTDFTFQTEK